MLEEGQVILFRFPQTDGVVAKLRPALVLRRCSGKYDDWLICMISSRLHQRNPEMDECITQKDADFASTGLKSDSVFRITRLAVVSADVISGMIGKLEKNRLQRIYARLSAWIVGDATS